MQHYKKKPWNIRRITHLGIEMSQLPEIRMCRLYRRQNWNIEIWWFPYSIEYRVHPVDVFFPCCGISDLKQHTEIELLKLLDNNEKFHQHQHFDVKSSGQLGDQVIITNIWCRIISDSWLPTVPGKCWKKCFQIHDL